MVPFWSDSRFRLCGLACERAQVVVGQLVKRQNWSRRELLEACVIRGLLVGAASAISKATLVGAWQRGQADARQPTSVECP